MKKLLVILLALLMLTACGSEDVPPTDPPTEPTEPSVPWTQAAGMAWDDSGVLLEMPLTIPDGMHYRSWTGFDGDLLMWSVDAHRNDPTVLELCLVELDDGSVIAQRDIPLSEYCVPQVLGDSLYICDRTAGTVYRLNRELNTVHQWTTEPGEGSWYMGGNDTLYILDYEGHLAALDLATGRRGPLMEGDPEVVWMTVTDNDAALEYYRTDTGAKTIALLDMTSGQLHEPTQEADISSIARAGDTWLWGKYMDGHIFYLSVDGAEPLRINGKDRNISLTSRGHLVACTSDNVSIELYDLEGKLISSARVFESGSGYAGTEMIWNEALGGYFLQVRGFDETSRLLFWDISGTGEGEDLTLTPVPKPDEAQAQLAARAEQIGQKYGLTVLVGEACDTAFDEFTAQQVTDWDRVSTALDTLEDALADYPEGFISQLRYDNIRGIRIHLISGLFADGSGRYGEGYAAFTQPQWDHYLMVVDIDDSTEQTYYHEFSHIIHSYLDWEATQRSDALYSPDEWASLNPWWFDGYSNNYADEHSIDEYGWFVDSYATVSLTEDMARVLEYAMSEYGQWTFEDAPGLQNKLAYYCRCIRDGFDTNGWPETPLWEQYLAVG